MLEKTIEELVDVFFGRLDLPGSTFFCRRGPRLFQFRRHIETRRLPEFRFVAE